MRPSDLSEINFMNTRYTYCWNELIKYFVFHNTYVSMCRIIIDHNLDELHNQWMQIPVGRGR